jgi:hypothetical protein
VEEWRAIELAAKDRVCLDVVRVFRRWPRDHHVGTPDLITAEILSWNIVGGFCWLLFGLGFLIPGYLGLRKVLAFSLRFTQSSLKCHGSGCIIRIAAFFPLSARGRERTGKRTEEMSGLQPTFYLL